MMVFAKNSKIILLVLFLCVLTVGIFVANSYNSESEIQIGTLEVNQNGTKIFTDVPVYNDISDMTKASEIVVVGRVTGKGNTRNLAKDPQDQNKEAKDRKVMSQEYQFVVESWVKGNGDDRLSIVYPEYTIIENKKIPEAQTSLEQGKRYILFLKQGISGTYYGIGEPWQFELVNNQATVRTAYQGELDGLKGLTEEDIIKEVQANK